MRLLNQAIFCNFMETNLMRTLGNTLKEARKNIGFTLREVEDSSGISNAYLSQLENDKIKNPSANILYKLSSLYKIPLNTLLSSAGIIESEPEEKAENSSFIQKVAFSAERMTEEEKIDVLKYLEFLRIRRRI